MISRRELLLATLQIPVVKALRIDNKDVITPNDFTFTGFYRFPNRGFGAFPSFRGRSFSFRKVSGKVRILVHFDADDDNPNSYLREVQLPDTQPNQVMGLASEVINIWDWGFIGVGHIITDGNQNYYLLGGSWFDPVLNGIWWTYTTDYVPSGPIPTLCFTYLNDIDGTFQTYGPWVITDKSPRFTQGSIKEIPPSFSQFNLGIGRWIGIAGSTGSGMAGAPFGASILALKLFDPYTTPPNKIGDAPVSTGKFLLLHDLNHKQSRDTDYRTCGWLEPNGPITSCGEILEPPVPFFAGNHPTQENDYLSFFDWIEGRGIFFLGALGRTPTGYVSKGSPDGKIHYWYGASTVNDNHCCHGQYDPSWIGNTGNGCGFRSPTVCIYNPNDLVAVANGRVNPWEPLPTTDIFRWQEKFSSAYNVHVPVDAKDLLHTTTSSALGTMVNFDKDSKRLYLCYETDTFTIPGYQRLAIQVFQLS